MGPDNPEIAKLKERIAKDPRSKLFVSLAEELRKGGDLDAAIRVLQDGLKHSPTYVTARSFLGRYLLEKGDLSAALKEFQAVAAAIPDNLLAQRKLGDILVLMDKEQEALARYRDVIKLTPRDVEVSGLIADLEAGRSVKTRIAQMQPSRPASSGPAGKAPSPVRAQGREPALQPQGGAGAPVDRRPASAAEEMPEDILAVEILVPGATGGTPAAPDVLAALPSEATEALTEELLEFAPDVPLDAGHEVLPELQIPDAGVLAMEADVLATVPEELAEEEGVLQEPASAARLKKADDFTTDTLAELYIAQGFYEKAIDIYERMLADNPGHQGLIDKLARLHSLAEGATAAEAAGPAGEAASFLTPVPEAGGDQQGDVAAAAAIFGREEAPEAIEEAGADASFDTVFEPAGSAQPAEPFFGAGAAEAREYVPPASASDDREPLQPSGGFDLFERDAGAGDREGTDRFAEFAPPSSDRDLAAPMRREVREFAKTSSSEKVGQGVSREGSAASPSAGREAVLGRLEQWLRNITKEK